MADIYLYTQYQRILIGTFPIPKMEDGRPVLGMEPSFNYVRVNEAPVQQYFKITDHRKPVINSILDNANQYIISNFDNHEYCQDVISEPECARLVRVLNRKIDQHTPNPCAYIKNVDEIAHIESDSRGRCVIISLSSLSEQTNLMPCLNQNSFLQYDTSRDGLFFPEGYFFLVSVIGEYASVPYDFVDIDCGEMIGKVQNDIYLFKSGLVHSNTMKQQQLLDAQSNHDLFDANVRSKQPQELCNHSVLNEKLSTEHIMKSCVCRFGQSIEMQLESIQSNTTSKQSPSSINENLIQHFINHPDDVYKKSKELAKMLQCSEGAIRSTPTWKSTRKAVEADRIANRDRIRSNSQLLDFNSED